MSSALAASNDSGSQSLKGATALLQEAEAHLLANSESGDAKKFADYEKRLPTLSAEEAANEWLALLDASDLSNEQSTSRLIEVLPPPSSWEALNQAIVKRTASKSTSRKPAIQLGLQLLGASLIRDREAIKEAIQRVLANFSDKKMDFEVSLVYSIGDKLAEIYDFPDIRFQIWEKRSFFRETSDRSIEIPDLIALVGEEKARVYLKKAVTTPKLTPFISKNNKTFKLAKEVILENFDELSTPPWWLIRNSEDAALYERITKKFGPRTSPSYFEPLSERESPDKIYLFSLIEEGRIDDAIAFKKEKGIFIPFLYPTFLAPDHFFEFFRKSLTIDPGQSDWSAFLDLGILLDQKEVVQKTLQQALDKSKGTPDAEHLQAVQRGFLLSEGKTTEVVAELRRLINENETTANDPLSLEKLADLSLELANIGLYLKDQKLATEGINRTIATLEKLPVPYRPDSYDERFSFSEFYNTLFAAGELRQLEHFLGKDLIDAAPIEDEDNAQNALLNLLVFYHETDRPNDVLALLTEAPFWSAADLTDLDSKSSLRSPKNEIPIPFIAANAFAQTGDSDKALPILLRTLDTNPGFDPAYRLLLSLKGEAALPVLEKLAKENPFEERPLIWKAQLHLEAKRLPEAEKAIRAAIAIDPSDGETGPGERMLAYKVLSDIQKAQGNEKDAKFFEEVVAAIRLSEEADRVDALGLHQKAIELYRQSLTHFDDAYCIQARLARKLFKSGNIAASEEHYRRAFELMPDSFGRVESHCFGCEDAFGQKGQQRIAEKVFTAYIEKNPTKPQAHYLLGYLREEEDRYPDAIAAYQKAVELDPDYLNAWKRLAGLKRNYRLPTELREEAARNIARLDPNQAGDPGGLITTGDLKSLWEYHQKALAKQNPGPLFPLGAKAKIPRTHRDDADPSSSSRDSQNDFMMRHPAISGALLLMKF